MRRFELIDTRLGKLYIYLSIPIQGFENFSQNIWVFLLEVKVAHCILYYYLVFLSNRFDVF